MTRERLQFLQRFLILADLLLTVISFSVSYLIRDALHTYYHLDLIPYVRVLSDAGLHPFTGFATLLVYVVPTWSICLACTGTYHEPWSHQGIMSGKRLVKAAAWATIATISVLYLLKLPYVGRAYLLIFCGLNLCSLYVFRRLFVLVARRFHGAAIDTRYLLVVGTGPSARAFTDRLTRNPEWHMKIVGFLAPGLQAAEPTVTGIPVLGSIEMLEEILDQRVIDEVIFAVSRSQLPSLDKAIHHCQVHGVQAVILANLFDVHVGRLMASEIAGWPVIIINTISLQEWHRLAKRAIDVIGATIGIILTAPLMLLIALAIRLTSAGPVLFRQERVGLNGRRFSLYKFRTMIVDAEQQRDALLALNEMDGPVFKISRDPRVTPVGAFLRRSSLDELPQLFNVLWGQMSLVGPRPPIPSEVRQYQAWQRRRLSMKPGITCLWQVNGRNKISFQQWMAMDLEYIDKWSLGLDLKIMMRTIPAVLKGEGAK